MFGDTIDSVVELVKFAPVCKSIVQENIINITNRRNNIEEIQYRITMLYSNIGSKKKFNRVLDELEANMDMIALLIMTLNTKPAPSEIMEIS